MLVEEFEVGVSAEIKLYFDEQKVSDLKSGAVFRHNSGSIVQAQ